MNNSAHFIVNVIYIIILLAVAFAAYKLGDKNGYEAGYEVGYSYDCREDIMALKRITDALSKSVNYEKEASSHLRRQNDSLKNAEFIKAKIAKHGAFADSANRVNDSLTKIDGKPRVRYTRTGMIKPPGVYWGDGVYPTK